MVVVRGFARVGIRLRVGDRVMVMVVVRVWVRIRVRVRVGDRARVGLELG